MTLVVQVGGATLMQEISQHLYEEDDSALSAFIAPDNVILRNHQGYGYLFGAKHPKSHGSKIRHTNKTIVIDADALVCGI
jgi:hypothetical protein